MKRLLLITLGFSVIVALSGCVRRIVTIDSQPQGADVYFDRKFIGQTPCKHEFHYYGSHHIELTKDGYANIRDSLKLKGPIYEYFPLSFISEVLIPWEITDRHTCSFELEKGEAKQAIISPITQLQPPLSGPDMEYISNRLDDDEDEEDDDD